MSSLFSSVGDDVATSSPPGRIPAPPSPLPIAPAAPDTPAPEAGPPAAAKLRWWAVFPVALPLIVLDAFWVIQAEKLGSGPYFTTISLFANVFFLLTVLLIANALVKRLAPRAALSQAELLLAYTMIAIGAALAGHDMLPSVIQMMGHPTKFATPENGWMDRFGQYLPTPLMVSDRDALRGYYQGGSSLYQAENWRPWMKPALLWSGFTIVLVWTMMCLNVLVRQGWQDRERLPFPVVEIPLQMTDPSGKLWKNGLFWAGFGLLAAIEILNGLAFLYPSIPRINLQHINVQGQGLFATRPWSAVGFTCYSFYPFAIGLGYLLPLDLLFSCWFFYLTWKLQAVIAAQFALDVTPDFPYVREQSFGGYLAIVGFVLWNGRHYFRDVFKRVLGEPTDLEDRTEALSYRQATFGALAGLGLLVGFLVWVGMSPILAIVAFLLYFALSVAVTRMRAEFGPPVHDLHYSGPEYILTHSFGTQAFSAQDLTLLSFFYWFNRAYRSHPMPFGIEGLKAAHTLRANQKVMLWGMMTAAVVGSVAVFWAYLHLAYANGTQAKFTNGSNFAAEAYNRLNGWIQAPSKPNTGAMGAMGIGFLFCAALMAARIQFPWWPLHPIGYAISSSWAINLVWMPLLIAWIVKGTVLRYGGNKLYSQLMPFFIGIILGQVVTGSAWHLLCLYLGVTPYSFWGG
ncbi:MAG: hypothetical protein H7Z41_05505 [Cytophagales bacterium]|nr:hypothetical protein [Armatimonadota bacterium]